MKKYAVLFVLIFGFISVSKAQEESKDIWYIWVDTYAQVDGVEKRIVSKELTKIDCCVKSPKYRKLLKSTVKWIRKDIDENYDGENPPLSKVQDKSLAQAALDKAQKHSDAHLVEYTRTCK